MIIALIIYFTSALIVNSLYLRMLGNDFMFFKILLTEKAINEEEYEMFTNTDFYEIGQLVPIINSLMAISLIILLIGHPKE